MSDLREKLAARLVTLFLRAHGGKRWNHFEGSGDLSLLPLADECIRQMEWARQAHMVRPKFEEIVGLGTAIQCPCGVVLMDAGNGILHWRMGHLDRPSTDLAPAPDDWKPE